MKKTKMIAGSALVALGLSMAGAPIASADPWVPGSGPLHPVRHYAADLRHPIWSVTHPFRALIP